MSQDVDSKIAGSEDTDSLYIDVGEGIIQCCACGAYALDGNKQSIKHFKSCGGFAEVKKWESYYSQEDD